MIVPAAIVKLGRARIAVPGGFLHVLELGAVLERRGVVNDGITLLYRGSTKDCAPCPLKARCCPNTPVRKIPRSIYEHARDVARSLAGTAAFERSRHDRERIAIKVSNQFDAPYRADMVRIVQKPCATGGLELATRFRVTRKVIEFV